MNDALRGSLSSLRTLPGAKRANIRPVSRVWFELSDKTAFDKCVQLVLKWMEPRSNVKLPSQAWDGGTFDITDELGANPTKAARVDASDGSLWASRLDFPDPKNPRTWVSEYFVEHRVGRTSRFGAQLTCVIRGESAPFEITRPRVIRDVIECLSAEADGRQVLDSVERLSRPDISELVDLLYNPNRRLPVIAISETESSAVYVQPNDLAKHVAGAAHIVHISNEGSWELTKLIGKRMSVFNGTVRLYLPGLRDDSEDPFQHPLLFPQESISYKFIKDVAARVLPAAFLSTGDSEDFPRYSLVRDIAISREFLGRDEGDLGKTQENDFELLRLEKNEAEEERDTWQSLALEEESRRLTAEADVERLKNEIPRLQAKIRTLEHRLSQHPAASIEFDKEDRGLVSYEDLEQWAEEVLGDHIYIHQAALKDCRKNGHDSMLSRIEQALLVVRDYLVPARANGGLEAKRLAKDKLAELGMEDSSCFANRDEAKRRTQYSVPYGGTQRVMYDHIKYGNGYDNANQIRIYYFWDDNNKFIVGKMPTHLPNNNTT